MIVAEREVRTKTIPRPRVTAHFAQSLDGWIATRARSGCWLSGPLATRFAHELRAASGGSCSR